MAPLTSVSSISGGRGKLTVTATCPAGGPACTAFTVTATITEHLKRGKVTAITAGRRGHASRTQTRRVVIASASASLAAAATKRLTITLNRAGHALLAKYGKLATIVTIISGTDTLKTATVHVQTASRSKRK